MGTLKLNQNYNASHPVAALKVAGTPEQIERGKKLASLCAGCHGDQGKLPLKGSNFAQGGPPVGTLWATNLTPAGELKDWSDGEIVRAIREGVHKSGRSLIVMPSEVFRNMSDDDVQSLVAYLRAQPPVEPANPPTNLNIVGAALLGTVFSSALTVQPPITQPIAAPPQGATAAYGKYLVDIAACRACHGEKLDGVTTGGPGEPAPNLTLVVPKWTEQEFFDLMRQGKLPDGKPVGKGMPWQEFNGFADDDELKAMYLYLHGLPPLAGANK